MTDTDKLKRLAEAATAGDLDTVPNPPNEYGGHSTGWFECPACSGQGEVEGATYCNFDHKAIGVQFFGIGNEFQNYEAYFRAANPEAILALIAENERLQDVIAKRSVTIADLVMARDEALAEGDRLAQESCEAVALLRANMMYPDDGKTARETQAFLARIDGKGKPLTPEEAIERVRSGREGRINRPGRWTVYRAEGVVWFEDHENGHAPEAKGSTTEEKL